MDRRAFLNAAGATSVTAAAGGLLSTRAFAQAKPETAKLAMGFGLAQDMLRSTQAGSQYPPPLTGAAGMPELLSPAQAAQALGVTEADVIASLDAGELKGKKIGSSWRITKTALDSFLAE